MKLGGELERSNGGWDQNILCTCMKNLTNKYEVFI